MAELQTKQQNSVPKLKRKISQANIHDQLKVFLIGSRRTGTVTLTSLLEEIGFGKKYHGWTLWMHRQRGFLYFYCYLFVCCFILYTHIYSLQISHFGRKC